MLKMNLQGNESHLRDFDTLLFPERKIKQCTKKWRILYGNGARADTRVPASGGLELEIFIWMTFQHECIHQR